MAIEVATILWTIGVLALIESIIIMAFPKWSIGMTRKIVKNKKKIQKIAFYELIVALVLILVGFSL